MNGEHSSDLELQQYALDPSGCAKEAIKHIQACEKCLKETASYEMLFTRIKDQPKAAFEFDISSLVLKQIPKKLPQLETSQMASHAQSQPAGARKNVWGFSLVTLLLVSFSACMIGTSLFLFRKNIWNMFAGISQLFMYLTLGASAIVVLFRIMNMYRKYQEQMRTLNYY
jgi:hypothetical protein